MKKILAVLLLALTFSLYAENSPHSVSNELLPKAEKEGMNVYWDTLTESGIIEKNGHQISFTVGSDIILQDYDTFEKTDAPEIKEGSIYVSQAFLNTAESFFKTEENEELFKIGAILIDPGHGGKDPGAIGSYTKNGKKVEVREKDVVLNIGKKLYNNLKASYPDKKILMTRSTDVFISLSQRTEIANSVKLKDNEAILYISIHANASLDKKASGYEVWYLTPGYRRKVIDDSASEDKSLIPILNSMMEEEYTTESILIANFVMDGIGAQVGKLSQSRGTKAEEWFVVRNANMPSVLVETGFVTNTEEAKLLDDESYLKKLALGMYNGISAFVTHFERSRGFTGEK